MAKSVVVLISQAMLDGLAIAVSLPDARWKRTDAPFWPSIGWREMRHGSGKIRDSALQFLAGGAVLAIVNLLSRAAFSIRKRRSRSRNY